MTRVTDIDKIKLCRDGGVQCVLSQEGDTQEVKPELKTQRRSNLVPLPSCAEIPMTYARLTKWGAPDVRLGFGFTGLFHRKGAKAVDEHTFHGRVDAGWQFPVFCNKSTEVALDVAGILMAGARSKWERSESTPQGDDAVTKIENFELRGGFRIGARINKRHSFPGYRPHIAVRFDRRSVTKPDGTTHDALATTLDIGVLNFDLPGMMLSGAYTLTWDESLHDDAIFGYYLSINVPLTVVGTRRPF